MKLTDGVYQRPVTSDELQSGSLASNVSTAATSADWNPTFDSSQIVSGDYTPNGVGARTS
jgi:hypothetical protein